MKINAYFDNREELLAAAEFFQKLAELRPSRAEQEARFAAAMGDGQNRDDQLAQRLADRVTDGYTPPIRVNADGSDPDPAEKTEATQQEDKPKRGRGRPKKEEKTVDPSPEEQAERGRRVTPTEEEPQAEAEPEIRQNPEDRKEQAEHNEATKVQHSREEIREQMEDLLKAYQKNLPKGKESAVEAFLEAKVQCLDGKLLANLNEAELNAAYDKFEEKLANA